MQKHIGKLLQDAVSNLRNRGDLPADTETDVHVTHSKDKAHGDFASNLALQLAGRVNLPAREIAEKIVAQIAADPAIAKIEIAGAGFINFYMRVGSHHTDLLRRILSEQDNFGKTDKYAGNKIQIEFVSANPTGPLHVGHGRGAAYGAAIANLLEAVGYEVYREYYLNDAGRQMDILATSVWLRYLELCGETIVFPDGAYRGDYVWDIAASLHREYQAQFLHSPTAWPSRSAANGSRDEDRDAHLDAVISIAKELLGARDYAIFAERALDTITDDIKDDLERFDVHFDNWYSERSLMTNDSLTTSNKVQTVLDELTGNGHTYNKDGARWFRSTAFGDEKDRVLRRENGQTTYFASDVAYHLEKYERGFDQLINIWGADHHGYIARVKAALAALGKDPKRLRILLVQFANLYEGGVKLAMSTRSGEFVTLRQLRKQVGKDAARFFYVMRKCEQHLDFDLDLAVSQSQDNPVYYVQYAHARICSIFKQADNHHRQHDFVAADTVVLVEEQERTLMKCLDQFQEKVLVAAKQLAPHVVVNYLRELATAFHSFYNAHQVLVDDPILRDARLKLIHATQVVLRNGLALLDVSAPRRM